jgi:hypothetical protein
MALLTQWSDPEFNRETTIEVYKALIDQTKLVLERNYGKFKIDEEKS